MKTQFHTVTSVSIIVPSAHNYIVGDEKIVQPANAVVRDRVINLIGRVFANRYGGFTSTEQNGGWVDSDTQAIVWEHSTNITALTGKLTSDDTALLVSLAKAVKEIFNQDAVLVMVGNRGIFV